MSDYALAVDVGATKVALALVDSKFTVVHKHEVLVHQNSRLWEEIAQTTLALIEHAGGSVMGEESDLRDRCI